MDFYRFAVIILFDVQVAPDIGQWEPLMLASLSFRHLGATGHPGLLYFPCPPVLESAISLRSPGGP